MPSTADAIAAQQVQDHLKSLTQLVHETEKKRQQSAVGVSNIVKLQSEQDDKESQRYQKKLKSLYKESLKHCEQEEEMLRKALQRIAEIRKIKNERRVQEKQAGKKTYTRKSVEMKIMLNSAQTLPLFVGKIDEKPPSLCGAIPADHGYIAKVGDMVAAKVKISEDEEDYILAEGVSFNSKSGKYEVDDIMTEQNQKARHTLRKKAVVPLPLMRANPETDPDALFPHGATIMALYPATSCFYQGIVNKPPATHTDEYEILFEDSTYSVGYGPPMSVPQRYVIAIKQKRKVG